MKKRFIQLFFVVVTFVFRVLTSNDGGVQALPLTSSSFIFIVHRSRQIHNIFKFKEKKVKVSLLFHMQCLLRNLFVPLSLTCSTNQKYLLVDFIVVGEPKINKHVFKKINVTSEASSNRPKSSFRSSTIRIGDSVVDIFV